MSERLTIPPAPWPYTGMTSDLMEIGLDDWWEKLTPAQRLAVHVHVTPEDS